jgi:AcrR family transcriptional regulator
MNISPRVATQERLIAGTQRCLARHGVAGTTARRIAEASGVNLAGIGYHFGGKDDLIGEALLHAIDSWLAPAVEHLDSGDDPVASTLRAVGELQESLARARDLLPAYFEAVVQPDRFGRLRDGVRHRLDDLTTELASRVAGQVDAGELPAWIDPEPMAELLLAAIDGIALHSVMNPGATDPPALATQLVGLLVAARHANPEEEAP